ncbi:hypothetical protein M9435_000283 [Picochlorum sp. BPE23]|nr:hypothetical protein M9435_000283 [Picochlorum sp. BPE23]
MATPQTVVASGGVSHRDGGGSVVTHESRSRGGQEHDETWLVPTPPSLKGSECGERMGHVHGGERKLSFETKTPAQTIVELNSLLDQAIRTKKCSHSLHDVMNAWETQVFQVHEELLEVTRKLHRERRRYSLRVMEKECDAKRLRVETESLRGIVEAKTASLEALKSLQARADAKRDEAEEKLHKRILQLEEECRQSRDALAAVEEKQHASLKRFEDAGIDAETAAQQLLDAYADTAQLEEQIEELQIDLEKATRYSESQDKYYQSKIKDLNREIEGLRQEVAARGSMDSGPMSAQQHRRYAATNSPMARSHSGSVYSNPLLNAHGGDDGGSVCSHGTRDEDILAAEVTNLRMKTRDLESQASAASDSARLAGTFEKENVSLRKENAKLKSMVTASMSEASEAKVEVAKLTSEANVLHAQLAEVISAINSRAHKDIVLQQKQQNHHFHDDADTVGAQVCESHDDGAQNTVTKTSGAPHGDDVDTPHGDSVDVHSSSHGPLTPSSLHDELHSTQQIQRGRSDTVDTEMSTDIRALFKNAIDSVDASADMLAEDDVFS